jgi:hypothetical protein
MVPRAALVLLFGLAALSHADDKLPPRALVKENIAKAGAIVEGEITALEMTRVPFAVITLKISKSYRGPLRAGDTVSYRSIKETSALPKQWKEHGIVAFLVNQPDATGQRVWGTVTEFAEFEASAGLDKQIRKLLGSSK